MLTSVDQPAMPAALTRLALVSLTAKTIVIVSTETGSDYELEVLDPSAESTPTGPLVALVHGGAITPRQPSCPEGSIVGGTLLPGEIVVGGRFVFWLATRCSMPHGHGLLTLTRRVVTSPVVTIRVRFGST